MADQKITELTALTSASLDAANDVMAIVDLDQDTTKKITVEELLTNIDTNSQHFEDYASFITWADANTPDAGDEFSVYVGGPVGVVNFAYVGSGSHFTDSELDGYIPVAPIYLQHWNIVPSSTKSGATTDYTTRVQAALDYAPKELLFTGFVKITDTVTVDSNTTIHAPGGRLTGGFSVFSDFTGTTGIVRLGTGTLGATIGDLTIWGDQPASPVTKADLNQYPAAVELGASGGESQFLDIAATSIVDDRKYRIRTVGGTDFTTVGATVNEVGHEFLSTSAGTSLTGTGTVDVSPAQNGASTTSLNLLQGLTRAEIKNLRLEKLWDGVICFGNGGGLKVDQIESSCFNRNISLDGLLDFCHIDSVHIWPFDFADNATLTGLFYDTDTIGFFSDRVDGLAVDKLAVFRNGVVIGRDTPDVPRRLPAFFNSIGLDREEANILLKASNTTNISLLYSTSTTTSNSNIVCSGGYHQISQITFSTDSNLPVSVTGGYLAIQSGYVHGISANRNFLEVSGGFARVRDIIFDPPPASNRTEAFLKQSSTGALDAAGIRTIQTYADSFSVELVEYNTDVEGNYLNAIDCEPHFCTFGEGWTLGTYVRDDYQTHATGSTEQNIVYRAINDSTTGSNLTIGAARGVPGTPTAVQNTTILGDIVFSGYDGSAWNDSALIRAVCNGTVSSGVVPTELQFLVDSASGTVTPLIIEAGQVGINIEPTYAFHVDAGTSGSVQIEGDTNVALIMRASDAGISRVYFGDASSFNAGSIEYTHSIDRMKINSSGNMIFSLSNTDVVTISTENAEFENTITLTPVTRANLPGTPVEGMKAFVTDSDTAASGNFGATFAGGGANNVPVYYDGTDWRIG